MAEIKQTDLERIKKDLEAHLDKITAIHDGLVDREDQGTKFGALDIGGFLETLTEVLDALGEAVEYIDDALDPEGSDDDDQDEDDDDDEDDED